MSDHSPTDTEIDLWLADLGRQIAAARERQGLSVFALSKRSGVSRQQLTNVESGANSSLRLLAKIAAALKLQKLTFGNVEIDLPLMSRQSEAAQVIEESLQQLSRAVELLGGAPPSTAHDRKARRRKP